LSKKEYNYAVKYVLLNIFYPVDILWTGQLTFSKHTSIRAYILYIHTVKYATHKYNFVHITASSNCRGESKCCGGGGHFHCSEILNVPLEMGWIGIHDCIIYCITCIIKCDWFSHSLSQFYSIIPLWRGREIHESKAEIKYVVPQSCYMVITLRRIAVESGIIIRFCVLYIVYFLHGMVLISNGWCQLNEAARNVMQWVKASTTDYFIYCNCIVSHWIDNW
jgi:hypothetical protein